MEPVSGRGFRTTCAGGRIPPRLLVQGKTHGVGVLGEWVRSPKRKLVEAARVPGTFAEGRVGTFNSYLISLYIYIYIYVLVNKYSIDIHILIN